jgi:hypothetical protein
MYKCPKRLLEDSPNSLFWCVVIYTKKGFLEWLDGQLGGQLGGHYHGSIWRQLQSNCTRRVDSWVDISPSFCGVLIGGYMQKTTIKVGVTCKKQQC